MPVGSASCSNRCCVDWPVRRDGECTSRVAGQQCRPTDIARLVRASDMDTTEAAFLTLLGSGLLALLAGLILTRLHWRPDLPPYGRRTRLLDVALHPEAYAKDAPLRAIKYLNVGGAVLLASAAIIVLC